MNEIEALLEQAINKTDLQSSDIPAIDLYMDQIMTLFEDNLKDNKRHEDDKLLTKTMINNYSKAGIIKPVKGKKYTKEQILAMLVVYNLKNTISIQEIKAILDPLYQGDEKIEPLYDQFMAIKQQQKEVSKSVLLDIMTENNLDLSNQEHRLITIMVLSSLSNQLTSIVESIIDDYYQEKQ